VIIGLSVGVGVYPEHATDAESLLRAADGALFRAKAQGRNQSCVANPEFIDQLSAQFKTEQALRRAIQCDEFEVLYQPQVSMSTGEMTSVEALLRWRRDGAFVMPLDFLPLAEQSGLIGEITDWVMKRAVRALASWHHGAWPQAHVAVNISAQQFLDRLFVSRLHGLLKLYGVPPSSLELELTETVLQSGPATAQTLRELRELGVGIALDDFGAGYSSLASLDQLQISRVKIDRSLIENVDRNPRSASIARSMIALCRSLNLRVTAEGVERAEQLRFLSQCEDVDVQGFLMSQPVTVDRVMSTAAELHGALNALLHPIKEANRIGPVVTPFSRRGTPRPT
jgi:EAL domain-containing protein (putative c-di-GMP-specific phosphodiesterase class I)